MGPKTKIFNHGDKALNVSSFDLSRKNKQFKKEYQIRMAIFVIFLKILTDTFSKCLSLKLL